MSKTIELVQARPWHREPWPWLLMAAPTAAVIWGAATFWIAVHFADPLVTNHAWEDGKRLEQGASVTAPGSAASKPAEP